MGAQFEVADYAATGSGSPAVRGILYYENNWGKKPLAKLNEDEAVTVALRALDTAAESDTATGGVDRNGKIFPVIKIVSRDGITTLPESESPRSSNEASHDRRAIPLGRSDRESRANTLRRSSPRAVRSRRSAIATGFCF